MRRLTFVIPSFNYEAYVTQAIDSALAVQWPDIEVIVVDDGSTDRSVDVIASYGDRVQLIQQPNSGPRNACNVGFAASSGDWIVFLDADDLVDARVASTINEKDRPGLSKIQFQMQRIDADNHHLGNPFPRFRTPPTPDDVRRWMRATASYPTPPGSGNAYPRSFLERIFPLDDRCGDATDSACLAAAPFYGDVVTVVEPLMKYRVHGRNRSYLLADITRFAKQIERARQRHEYAQSIEGRVDNPRRLAPLYRSRHLLQLRVANYRLTRAASPLPGESFLRLLTDTVIDVFPPGPEGPISRVFTATFCISVLLLPRPVARWLIRARFLQPH